MADPCNCQGHYVQVKRGGALFLGLFLLGQSFDDFLLLGLEPLFPALASFLGLRPAGLSLVTGERKGKDGSVFGQMSCWEMEAHAQPSLSECSRLQTGVALATKSSNFN